MFYQGTVVVINSVPVDQVADSNHPLLLILCEKDFVSDESITVELRPDRKMEKNVQLVRRTQNPPH